MFSINRLRDDSCFILSFLKNNASNARELQVQRSHRNSNSCVYFNETFLEISTTKLYETRMRLI